MQNQVFHAIMQVKYCCQIGQDEESLSADMSLIEYYIVQNLSSIDISKIVK